MSGEPPKEKHFKKKEDEIDEQKNKSHRGLNKKLQKRRKHEKEVKKDKKQKKKEYEDKRDKYREQYFAQSKKSKSKNQKDSKGVKFHKLQKTVNKFLKIYEDDIEDVKGIFSSLDEGEEIEIQDIENPKIRKYLAKIFKYLKIKQKTGKLGYRKSLKTQFSLAAYMKTIISDGLLAITKKDSSSESDSDNEDNDADSEDQANKNNESDSSNDSDDEDHKKGKQPSKKQKKNSDDEGSDFSEDSDDDDKKKQIKKQEKVKQEAKKLGPQLPSRIGPSIPSVIRPIGPSVPSSSGPSLITQEEKDKFLSSSLAPETKEAGSNWMIQGDLDSFLNDSFKEVESSNVKKFLQNRKGNDNKRQQVAQLDSSRLAKGSAPIDLENIQIDESESKERSAAEYEAKYRSKSLMEIHQENLLKKKQKQGKDTFRKPFDRNEDLVIKKTDTKKLFAALQESFQHGPKFQPAKN